MEKFINREGSHRDDGRLNGASNPPKESTEFWLLLRRGEGKREVQVVTAGGTCLGANRGPWKMVLSLWTLAK